MSNKMQINCNLSNKLDTIWLKTIWKELEENTNQIKSIKNMINSLENRIVLIPLTYQGMYEYNYIKYYINYYNKELEYYQAVIKQNYRTLKDHSSKLAGRTC